MELDETPKEKQEIEEEQPEGEELEAEGEGKQYSIGISQFHSLNQTL